MIFINGYSIRASISLVREMSEGVCRRALKARAEVVEEDINDLLWDLDKHSTMHPLTF